MDSAESSHTKQAIAPETAKQPLKRPEQNLSPFSTATSTPVEDSYHGLDLDEELALIMENAGKPQAPRMGPHQGDLPHKIVVYGVKLIVSKLPPTEDIPTIAGKNLAKWLSMVLRSDEDSAIDVSTLRELYRSQAEPPLMSDELIIQLLVKLFGCTPGKNEVGGRAYILRLRWLTSFEGMAYRAAAAAAADPGNVSMDIKKRCAEVTSFLLTSGVGKAAQELKAKQGGGVPGPVDNVADKELKAKQGGGIPGPGDNVPDQDSAANTPDNEGEDSDGDVEFTHDENLQWISDEWDETQLYYEDDFEYVITCPGVRGWVEQVLVADNESRIDPYAVHQAFSTRTTAPPQGDPEFRVAVMAMIITTVFPGAQWKKEGDDPPLLKGVRWRKLERPAVCLQSSEDYSTAKLKRECRKLLHEPEPRLTRLWLQMLFVADENAATCLRSSRDLYLDTVLNQRDVPDSSRSLQEFDSVVLKTFRNAQRVEVCDGYFVCHGLRMLNAKDFRRASEVMTQDQQRRVRRLAKAGKIDPPNSVFAQKLLENPLLPRAVRTRDGKKAYGSLRDLLDRRQTNPRKPHGDFEPGFPTVSMKELQLQYKADLKEYERKLAEELDKAASLPTAAAPRPPPPPPPPPPA